MWCYLLMYDYRCISTLTIEQSYLNRFAYGSQSFKQGSITHWSRQFNLPLRVDKKKYLTIFLQTYFTIGCHRKDIPKIVGSYFKVCRPEKLIPFYCNAQNCLTILVMSFQRKQFSENILRRNVEQKPTINSPSNTCPRCAYFKNILKNIRDPDDIHQEYLFKFLSLYIGTVLNVT